MTDIPPGATPIIGGSAPEVPTADPTFWYALVDERVAGDFIDQTPRTMQGLRQKGGGPPFIRLSSRCIKYRRIDLKQWADERLRSSTSDPGPEPHDPVPDIRSAAHPQNETPPAATAEGANVVERDNTKRTVRNEEYTSRHR